MASVLRLIAVVICLLLLAGLAIFVSEKAGEGSRTQVDRLSNPGLSLREEKLRERRHGPVREFIDDSNDLLLKPFVSLFDFKDAWPRRLVPTALALLLFGGGLTLLANYLPTSEKRSSDWRTAR